MQQLGVVQFYNYGVVQEFPRNVRLSHLHVLTSFLFQNHESYVHQNLRE